MYMYAILWTQMDTVRLHYGGHMDTLSFDNYNIIMDPQPAAIQEEN